MENPFFDFSLLGKNIIVTGGSSGIGRTTVQICSRLGATLILAGRDEPRLSSVLKSLDNPEKHRAFVIDITNHSRVVELIGELKTAGTPIDGMVHAAGISTTLPFRMTTMEKMDTFLRTNTMGGINITREVITQGVYSKEGMAVVFIASVMGMVGEKGKSIYSITKGALIAGARSMAVELADKNIRVNVVSPGVVETPMTGKAAYSKDEKLLNQVRDMHPLGIGKPEDVANACVYLLSNAGRWITGSNLVVDGGYTAK